MTLRVREYYGTITQRDFQFTRREVEQILRDAAATAPNFKTPSCHDVEVEVIMNTDGIDLEGEPLFTVRHKFTKLEEKNT